MKKKVKWDGICRTGMGNSHTQTALFNFFNEREIEIILNKWEWGGGGGGGGGGVRMRATPLEPVWFHPYSL